MLEFADKTNNQGITGMFLAMTGFVVCGAIFFAIVFGQRASGAGQSAAQWALTGGIGYLVGLSVLLWIINLLGTAIGLPDYARIWIGCIVWFVATVVIAYRSDPILDSKLPRRA